MNFKIDGDNYSEKICKFKEIFKILCAILHVKAGQLVGVDMYVCICSICPGPHSPYPSPRAVFFP